MGGEAGPPPFEAVESARERRTFLSVNFVERVYTHYPWDVSNGHLNEPADRVGRVDDVGLVGGVRRHVLLLRLFGALWGAAGRGW